MSRQIHKLEDGREIVIKIERDHSTKWAVLANIFGIVAIFFMPLVFFPLDVLCFAIGLLASMIDGRLSNFILSLVSLCPLAVAFATSPSLWAALVTIVPSPFQH